MTCSKAIIVSATERLLRALRSWPRSVFRRILVPRFVPTWMRTLGTVAGLAFVTNGSANVQEKQFKAAPDPRFSKLESFFRRYNCPAPQHILTYLRAADGYGLDYRLLPALSVRESQCGRTERQNNRWGYKSGQQGFASLESGIDYVARQLSQARGYQGRTLYQKLFTYNPLAAYPSEIMHLMGQIE